MSKIFIETDTLTGIANAIRSKTGDTQPISTTEMATQIEGITTGGNVAELTITSNGTYTAPEGIDGYTPITVNVPQDGSPPPEAFVITGNCEYKFAYGGWDWFIKQYGNQITTENISNAKYMFADSYVEKLPFNINFKDNNVVDCGSMFKTTKIDYLTEENVAGMANKIGSASSMFQYGLIRKIPSLTFNNSNYHDLGNMFQNCDVLEEIGDLINIYPSDMGYFFNGCKKLKSLPKLINPNWSKMETYDYASMGNMFMGCAALRSIPEGYFDNWYVRTKAPKVSFFIYYSMFQGCNNLEEVLDLPFFIDENIEIKENLIRIFYDNPRLKRFTFKTNEDGAPKILKWKNQIIFLDQMIGYAQIAEHITEEVGLTEATRITDDATYQALKDNPDSWTTDINYSRYNRTSAVETINSLPDTSAYLASSGGTNTIKFEGASGLLTDGGAINTMTEEEIAVATAKGWTVSFV